MEAAMRADGFTGKRAEFVKRLYSDPKYFFRTSADLIRECRDIAKRINPQLMRQFGRLPRTPYGVEPVPAYREKTEAAGYYEQGAIETGRRTGIVQGPQFAVRAPRRRDDSRHPARRRH